LSQARGLPDKKVVITGPKLSAEVCEDLIAKYPQFIFRQFIKQYAAFVANAAFFVGLAGYNTISAWLKGKKPALMISRAQVRGEQELHLQTLANLGLCITLNEDDATSEKLVKSLEVLGKRRNIRHNLAVDGGIVVADYIDSTIR
jgi:predicted glycosyltransferase